jgi:cytoskeletal protein CcmA (bactofilin family)
MSTNPNQPTKHIDEMAGLQYLEGQLERTRALELSAHTERCDECRALLSVLERESRLLMRAMREQEEPVPARLLAPVRERMPWAWIISFGMAAAGSYWLWTTIIDPWQGRLNEAGFGGTNLVTMLFFQGALWKGWGSMWTLVQVLAVISMCGVGYLVLRRGLRRMNTIALVMGTIVAALFLPSGVSAAEVHKNEPNYTLPSSATVKDDLIVFGNNIRIDGTVDGDLIAFGANISVNGHVTGDVLSGGTTLQINGIVDGNVRFGGSMLNLHGKIGKNLMAGCGGVLADSTSEIGWGATIGSGDVTLDGKIGRDILAGVGHMHLGGSVGGSVTLEVGQTFDIGSSAQVKGKIKYEAPKEADIASGAQLASAPEFTLRKRETDTYSGSSWWHRALAWGASFVFGLMLMLLAPKFFSDTVQNTNRYGASIGIGLLLIAGILIAAVLACITVVGLSVGLTTLMLYVISIYASKLFVATWLGRMLLGKGGYAGFYASAGKATWKTSEAVGQMALGLVVIYGLRMIPYVGFWVALAVTFWGLGALGITLYGKIGRRGVVEAVATA